MENRIYDALMAEIRKRIPQNAQMVKTLTEILFIEKEAVYRRLRQEVPFSFNEIVLIAKAFNISLDTIIGIETQRSRPFQMKLPDFIEPKEDDKIMINGYLEMFRNMDSLQYSETGMVSNDIPQSFFAGFPILRKFYVFNWAYIFKHNILKFNDYDLPDIINISFTAQFKEMQKVKISHYIFDNHVFRHLVNNIKYFNNIRLLGKEDTQIIKRGLLELIDYLESLALSGKFETTGNAVNLYISDLDLTTSYSYLEIGETQVSMVKAFLLTAATSPDPEVFQTMKNWIHSLINFSTKISVSNVRQRVVYFDKQRQIINKL